MPVPDRHSGTAWRSSVPLPRWRLGNNYWAGTQYNHAPMNGPRTENLAVHHTTRVRTLQFVHGGFTLIELLVVVSIVALLIALLLPALAQARRTAWTTMCAANLHQIAIGTTCYLNDQADRFPTVYAPGIGPTAFGYLGKTGAPGSYYDLHPADRRPINAYLQVNIHRDSPLEIAHCPADVIGNTRYASVYDVGGASYCFNVNWTARTLSKGPDGNDVMDSYRGIAESEIPVPSRFVLVGDFPLVNTPFEGSHVYSKWQKNWHSDDTRDNTTFADGHTALIPIQNLAPKTEDYTFVRD